MVPVVISDDVNLEQASEATLLRRAQGGDRTAFAHVIESYYDRLYRWLYHLTHDSHLAEDLVQETFLKAFANLQRFQPDTNFRAWLFRIAHNNWINQHRATKRCREPFPDDVPQTNSEEPIDQLLHQENLERLAQAIDQLPEDFRGAFLLRVDEELSFRQIGQILGLTEETARWRVFKARKQLIQILNDREET